MIALAIEILATVCIAAFSGNRVNAKLNRMAQALERSAAAAERANPPPKELPRPSMLDVSLEKRDGYPAYCESIATIRMNGKVSPTECYAWYMQKHIRHATIEELVFIDKTPGCAYEALMGSDGRIYPEHCRQ